MRIAIYHNGHYLTSEEPLYAMTNCMAFINAMENPGKITTENASYSLNNMMENHFDEWFEEIVNHHELHIVDLEGNRLYDQYLITNEVNNGN